MDRDDKPKHIDLFSGIGGFALAAQWAGFETIVFCEKDPYCQKVLIRRFGGYATDPKDTRTRKNNEGIRAGPGRINRGEKTTAVPIIPEIRDFEGTKFRGATLLTGGFPCQPFSVAGNKKGKKDDRYLWPEMFRVIKEAKPNWLIIENVTGIINMVLGQVLSDLESIGYDFPRNVKREPIVPIIPASAVNAPHRRDRVWIIAHSVRERAWGEGQEVADKKWETSQNWGKGIRQGNGEVGPGGADPANQDAPNTESDEFRRGHEDNRRQKQFIQDGIFRNPKESWSTPWPEVATCFCRMAHGLPPWIYRHRTKRLKALGNAIVPQVAYEIIRGIKELSIK